MQTIVLDLKRLIMIYWSLNGYKSPFPTDTETTFSFRCCNSLFIHKAENSGYQSHTQNLPSTDTVLWLFFTTTFPTVHLFTMQTKLRTLTCKVYGSWHSPSVFLFCFFSFEGCLVNVAAETSVSGELYLIYLWFTVDWMLYCVKFRKTFEMKRGFWFRRCWNSEEVNLLNGSAFLWGAQVRFNFGVFYFSKRYRLWLNEYSVLYSMSCVLLSSVVFICPKQKPSS